MSESIPNYKYPPGTRQLYAKVPLFPLNNHRFVYFPELPRSSINISNDNDFGDWVTRAPSKEDLVLYSYHDLPLNANVPQTVGHSRISKTIIIPESVIQSGPDTTGGNFSEEKEETEGEDKARPNKDLPSDKL